ncbi:sodium-coupled monocarboxylate transporter 1-like [Eupeodes corollae]|uniref:sodium-coupled monocarboxylate transporter 1-like n=1 Tax=Eupeodes corollae TaxID=290404 RepID=UPI0024935B44|nr:sodium-coupled monocarboxylate transporter 1-like [Eupeodes corollae]
MSAASNITDTVETFTKIFTFGFEDYAVFISMLVVSAGIGVYFGFFSGKNDTADEYLLGGRNLKAWPVAISLVSSQLSAISIVTIPSEMYSFGITFAFTMIAMFGALPILMYIIIPVFYNNNISNCYEYLELRFNKTTRQILTLSFVLTGYLLMPVFIFIPALSFAQVTGVNIHLINAIVCSICVFYTMLGGIKAVVWTDVVQAVVMVISVTIVGIMGVIAVGGLENVIGNAKNGGRLDVNMNFDVTTRTTLWNASAGGLCLWVGHIGLSQVCVQRIVALPSLGQAKKSLFIFAIGFIFVMFFNCFTGIIMYSMYHDCDPLKIKIVDKPDKMMPFFVQDVVGHLKGMPGLFISCVFSAALSAMSASMNSLAGIFYFDYVKPFVNHSERKANLSMKGFILFTGFFCVAAGFLVEKSASLLQTIMTIGGVVQGAMVGVFMLGFLVPKANGKSALIGLLSSMLAILVLVTGAQRRMEAGKLAFPPLPSRDDGCDRFNYTLHGSIFRSNVTNEIVQTVEHDEGFSIFEISFQWYTILGIFVVWIVAIPLSYVIPDDKKLDHNLLSPIIQKFVRYDSVKTDDYPMKKPHF